MALLSTTTTAETSTATAAEFFQETATQVATAVWQDFGTELIIFMVTFVVAMIMRQSSAIAARRRAATVNKLGKQHAYSKVEGLQRPKKAFSPRQSATSLPTLEISGDTSTSNAFDVDTLVLVERIIVGTSQRPCASWSSQALTMHTELQASLQNRGVRLVEAAADSKYPLVDFYSALVQCALRIGKSQLIKDLIEDMVKQGVRRPLAFYESTMKQLAGQKQHRLALDIYDCLVADGLEPSVVTCSCLISFAADVGDLERALSFFEKLKTMTKPSIRAYMTVLRVYAKWQDFPASLKTLADMRQRGVTPDALILNIVLATGVAVDQIEGVEKLMAEDEGAARPIADTVSYNTLIKGYALRGNVEAAINGVDRMRARELYPNAITFNTSMDACVRSGKIARAFELMQEMRRSRIRPDKFTCSILVKGLGKTTDVAHVEQTLALLHQVAPGCDGNLQAQMYNAVYEAASRTPGAEAIAQNLSQAGSRPSQEHVARESHAIREARDRAPPTSVIASR